jgi:hypothetical protein
MSNEEQVFRFCNEGLDNFEIPSLACNLDSVLSIYIEDVVYPNLIRKRSKHDVGPSDSNTLDWLSLNLLLLDVFPFEILLVDQII